MNPSSAPPVVPTKRRRRLWLRTLALLSALALIVVGVFLYLEDAARRDWDAAVAETDLLDPAWRLEDMLAERNDIPVAENSVFHVAEIVSMAGTFGVGNAPNYGTIFGEIMPPTAQLNVQQTELLRRQLAKIAKPLEEARKLKDMPRGRYPFPGTDDFMSSYVPEHQYGRTLVEWLNHDTQLLAQDKRIDEAVESCQAILNIGRISDGDISLITYFLGAAIRQISISVLERVLAQGEASETRLQAMQALLEKELNESSWLLAIRGERAGMHRLFDNVRTGKMNASVLASMGLSGGKGPPSVAEEITFWLDKSFSSRWLKDYPDYLRHQNRVVEIAKLPIHERGPKIQELEAERDTSKNRLIRMAAHGTGKTDLADRLGQAKLRATIAALACERYRLKHHRWPATLDVLVKEKLLAAIPVDPMDNQPIRYRRTKDGVVVYSISFDLTDNQGNINREATAQTPGIDIGFRLWDVRARRQPARPPVAIEP